MRPGRVVVGAPEGGCHSCPSQRGEQSLVEQFVPQPTVEGDALLQEAALRLEQSMRSGDFVARLGGDEFAILLQSREPGEVGAAVANRILKGLLRPWAFGNTIVQPGGTIGFAHCENGASPDALLQRADRAL